MSGYWSLAGTIIAQLIIGVFIYGQLTQRVKDQSGWLKRHEGEIVRHGETLMNHEGRLSTIEGRAGIATDR
ncbi:hypothetical protein ACOBR2_06600 [Telmatobacter bradus]|uniref:hypothetical protein n=1 Tax=Telmatobacter bradus TaxID=474953 RepID=UPI003B42F210